MLTSSSTEETRPSACAEAAVPSMSPDAASGGDGALATGTTGAGAAAAGEIVPGGAAAAGGDAAEGAANGAPGVSSSMPEKSVRGSRLHRGQERARYLLASNHVAMHAV